MRNFRIEITRWDDENQEFETTSRTIKADNKMHALIIFMRIYPDLKGEITFIEEVTK